MLIKVKFLKDDKPFGRAYTYRSPEAVKVGDLVQINQFAKGVVTEINVSEEEVIGFADKLKNIIGKAQEQEGNE